MKSQKPQVASSPACVGGIQLRHPFVHYEDVISENSKKVTNTDLNIYYNFKMVILSSRDFFPFFPLEEALDLCDSVTQVF